MGKIKLLSMLCFLLLIASVSFAKKKNNYSFDQNGISRKVLENYLDRSIKIGRAHV
jgi:hypothetical protein